MPVVLEGPEAEAAWLSEDVGVQEALEFLVPLESAAGLGSTRQPGCQ